MAQLFLTSGLRSAVLSVLKLVTSNQLPLDKSYAQQFFNKEYSSEDHARITQITGGIVRKLNLYAYLVECSIIKITEDEDRFDLVLFAWCLINEQKLPAFLEPTQEDKEMIVARLESAKDQAGLLDGCPKWLEQLGSQQLGDQWPVERAALALPAKRFIRANTLKISVAKLQEFLRDESIKTDFVEGVPDALDVVSNSALFKSDAFKKGFFEQQDAGSQLIVQAVGAQPKMRVIDACAGAGGKTLGLAAQMQSKGRLLAMDTEEYKLDTLKQRAKRASADNVEVRVITSSKTIKRLKESADRVLLDVPCTGSGVLKRNPDAKWRDDWSQTLPALVTLQQDLLTRYSKMVKLDGIILYATCSIFPVENQQQVATFLESNLNFKLLEEASISPAESGFDGFYWAKIQRIAV